MFCSMKLHACAQSEHNRVISEDTSTRCTFNTNVSDAQAYRTIDRSLCTNRPVKRFAVVGEGQETVGVAEVAG